MSKASRFLLMLAGLAATVCVFVQSNTVTDTTVPRFLENTEVAQKPVTTEPRRAAEPSPPASEPIVVTIVQRPAERFVALAVQPIPRGRDAIGRQLQKELKRVGCYAGQLNGVWTTSTRRGMQAFIDRVNATLPTNEPDGILLTLVQAQPDKVCGKPCPARQGLSNAGLCLPYAILARTGGAKIGAMPGETQISTINGWATTTVADAAFLPPTNTEPLVDPTPPTTIAPAQKSAPRRAIASRRQPQVSRKGNWAQNLFNQSLN